MRILGLNAAKEKLEIVIGADSPQILNFFAGLRLAEVALASAKPSAQPGSATQAGGLPRPEPVEGRKRFGLIQEYCRE